MKAEPAGKVNNRRQIALTVYRRGALEVLRRLQARATEAALEHVQAEEGEGYPLTGDTDLW